MIYDPNRVTDYVSCGGEILPSQQRASPKRTRLFFHKKMALLVYIEVLKILFRQRAPLPYARSCKRAPEAVSLLLFEPTSSSEAIFWTVPSPRTHEFVDVETNLGVHGDPNGQALKSAVEDWQFFRAYTRCGPHFGTKFEAVWFFLCCTDWSDSIYRRETKYSAFVLFSDKQTSSCVYKLFTRTGESSRNIMCPIRFML